MKKKILITFFAMCALLLSMSLSGAVGVASTAGSELPKMYFGDNRLLWKAGLLGDFRTTFLPLPPDLGYVAVDATEQKIYFMDYYNKWIKRMDLDGTNIEDVLSEERLQELGIGALGSDAFGVSYPGLSYIDTVDKKVYWVTQDVDLDTDIVTSTIHRMNIDGTGEIQNIISVEDREICWNFIDEVSRRSYWLEDEFTDDGLITTIRSSNLDGSYIRSHVTGIRGHVSGISIDNVKKQVYWIAVTEDEVGSGTQYFTLRRANLESGMGVNVGEDVGEIVIDLGIANTTGLFVDEVNRFLYWTGEQYFLDIDKYVYAVQRANIDDEIPTAEVVVRTRSDWLSYVTLNHSLGKLYWTESDELPGYIWTGSLWSVKLDGTEEPKNLTYIDPPGGIAVDTAHQKLYWTVPSLGLIRCANLDGTDKVDILTGSNQPENIVVDTVGEKIYWTEGPRSDENGDYIDVWSIRRANLDGTNWEVFYVNWDIPEVRGLAIDVVDRTIYVTSQKTIWDNGEIIAINVDSGDWRFVAWGLNNPLGIAVDSAHRQLYWTEPEEGTVKRSNLDGTRRKIIIKGLVNPRGIAVDPYNEKIYVTANEVGGYIGVVKWANLDGAGLENVIENADPSVKYIALGIKEAKPCSVYPTGDVNGDFKVNSYDAVLIIKFSVGLIDKFPVDELLGMSPENSVPRHYDVSVPKLRAFGGERLTVPITINDATGFLAGGVRLKYDPTALKAEKAYLGLNGAYWKASTDIYGEVRVAFVSFGEATQDSIYSRSLPSSDTLFIVEFNVLSEAEGKESPVILDYVELSNSLSIQKTDGLITILPSESRLYQNYPNPFNPDTWIPYQLNADSDVKISIYDARGAIVRQLTLGNQPAGLYITRDKAAYWDGRNSAGELVGSGVYFYLLKAGNFVATRKMVILK